MADNLSLAKDWIYVLCTPIQTVLAIIGLIFVNFWWVRRKAKDERKRADQQRREEERQKEIQREEDRQKADAEKIAAILSENYYEVENIFHRLKGSVDKLREKKVVGDWTEFHVLLYMCHQDNWHKFSYKVNKHVNIALFNIQNPQHLNSQKDPRDEVLSDVEKIMKFILKLRINLFSIMQNKACPNDIKSEFSFKITEMGKTIHPFVKKHRQDVIERVSKYFVSAAIGQDHATPYTPVAATMQCHSEPSTTSHSLPNTRRCFPCTCMSVPGMSKCCGRQDTTGEASEMIPMRSSTSFEVAPPNANANQDLGLINYPGHAAIENAIPYLKCFSYKSYQGLMRLEFYNAHPRIIALMDAVELGEMQNSQQDEILREINEFWRRKDHEPPSGGLLHSIRMMMFMQSEDRNFINEDDASFLEHVGQIELSENATECECERMLDDINMHTSHLRYKYKSLLALDETKNMLSGVKNELKDFISKKVQ